MKFKRCHCRIGVALLCVCTLALLVISCQPPQRLPTHASTAPVIDASPTPEVNQSTPQEAVLSYYQAFNERNPQMMEALLDPEDESNQRFLRGFQGISENAIALEVGYPQIYVVEESEKWTRIRTNHHQKVFQNGRLIAEADSGGEFTLIRKGDKWYLIGVGDPIPPGWLLDPP